MLSILLACAEPEDNRAPEVIEEGFANGSTIEVDGDGVLVYVVVEDPEEDPVTFVWELSEGGTPESTGIVARVGSQVDLDQDPALDGQTLRCAISDGTNTIERSWPLVVVE